MQNNINTINVTLHIPIAEMPQGGMSEYREREEGKGNIITLAKLIGATWEVQILRPMPAPSNIIKGECRVINA